ncbi:hypothetical protein FQZ97_1203980 [compost metagenome]
MSCGEMLPISRLSRCSATSSVPWRNSVEFRNTSTLKSASMSLASIFIMSARMSLSENTAAKRRVGWACAQAGITDAAANAAPVCSTERRLKWVFMAKVSCCGW